MKRALTLAVVLAMTSLASADFFDLTPSGDALIDSTNPDANFGADEGSCASGKNAKLVLRAWDFSGLAGWTATSDGVFDLTVWWKEGELCLSVYELLGGAFDEATVTWNSYIGGGTIDDARDPMAPLDTLCTSGQLLLSIPQATIQKLIDGTIAGLVTGNPPDSWWNHCQATKERDWQMPHLTFNAVPEPATLVVLALGGLLALRRRR